MKHLIAALALGLSATAHSFEIKGFALGQQMDACAAGTAEQKDKAIPGGMVCEIDVQTIANQPVQKAFATRLDGKIVALFFDLPKGDRFGHSEIKDALIEKFGRPGPSSKPHVNEYVWEEGSYMLAFDGWKGSVMTMDVRAVLQARRRAAAQSKNDL